MAGRTTSPAPGRRFSIDPEADPAAASPDGLLPPHNDAAAKESSRSKKPVAWKDLPQKQQLAIITISRLSEPLVQTSLQVRHLRPGAYR